MGVSDECGTPVYATALGCWRCNNDTRSDLIRRVFMLTHVVGQQGTWALSLALSRCLSLSL